MTIDAKIHCGSSQQKIIIKDNIYHIYIHSIPENGKANRSIVSQLSEYFNVSKNSIKIISGSLSRHKIINISE